MTLKESIQKTNDILEQKNEFISCVTTKLSFIDRNIYWQLSDYKVSGVSGNVIWLRKNS